MCRHVVGCARNNLTRLKRKDSLYIGDKPNYVQENYVSVMLNLIIKKLVRNS